MQEYITFKMNYFIIISTELSIFGQSYKVEREEIFASNAYMFINTLFYGNRFQ